MEELDISKIKVVPSDSEIPVNNFPILTKRSLCANSPENATLLDRINAIKIITDLEDDLEKHPDQFCNIVPKVLEDLQAVFNPLNVTECSSDLFNKEYETIKSIDELKKLLSELLVRFDTNPEHYTKDDYSYLMGIIYKSLLHLYEVSTASVITTEWNDPLRDDLVPSEKLTKETIDLVLSGLELEINTEVSTREASDIRLLNNIDLKQNILIPGDNILIEGDTISATDTIYDDTVVRELISDESSTRAEADENLLNQIDDLNDFTPPSIIPTTTNFVPGTTYSVTESLQRTANLFAGQQNEIDDINALIPNQATTSNQLADKDFVNSTVATNAANFRGNWSDWNSVPTDPNSYPTDYVGNRKPTNNDYMVLMEASGYDTQYTGQWRFMYIGDWDVLGKSGWKPQYKVGAPFTAAQQAALNSTITSEKVSQYDSYNGRITAVETDKLDKVYSSGEKLYGTTENGSQTMYQVSSFASKTDLDNLLPLIYAGL